MKVRINDAQLLDSASHVSKKFNDFPLNEERSVQKYYFEVMIEKRFIGHNLLSFFHCKQKSVYILLKRIVILS